MYSVDIGVADVAEKLFLEIKLVHPTDGEQTLFSYITIIL
jgi:hypothetical protein